jgi:hypothetical protein
MRACFMPYTLCFSNKACCLMLMPVAEQAVHAMPMANATSASEARVKATAIKLGSPRLLSRIVQ